MIPWRIAEKQNLFDVALRAILPVAIRKVQVSPVSRGMSRSRICASQWLSSPPGPCRTMSIWPTNHGPASRISGRRKALELRSLVQHWKGFYCLNFNYASRGWVSGFSARLFASAKLLNGSPMVHLSWTSMQPWKRPCYLASYASKLQLVFKIDARQLVVTSRSIVSYEKVSV